MPPPRKTTRQKALQGTLRADRQPRADFSSRLTTLPPPPHTLSAAARKIWRAMGAACIGIGTLCRADLMLLELLAVTLEMEAQARAALTIDGFAIAAGSGGKKRHPASSIAENARRDALTMMDRLGLTPKGRQSIDTAPPPAAVNPFLIRKNSRPPPYAAREGKTLDEYLAEGEAIHAAEAARGARNRRRVQ